MPSGKSEENQICMELNGTHQLLFCTDDSRDVGLEINVEKTKYMIISHHPYSGQKQIIRIANELFQNVAKFKYSGMILTNQNGIHDENKSRLHSGNACYHSVQNLLSSHIISTKLKIKIYKTAILPVALYGCKTWSFNSRNTD
jgi:hypothetical protein